MEQIEKIFGLHACISVLNNKKRKISKILCTKDTLKKIQAKIHNQNFIKNVKILKRLDLDNQLKTTIHQGIVVFAEKRKILAFESKINNQKQVLILDSLNDSQNVGSIIRSANLFGIEYIFFNEKNSFSINPILIKAATGAYEKVNLIPVKNLVNLIKTLKENNFWILGLEASAGKKIAEIDKSLRIATILGSENKGIRKLVKENCDFTARIPVLNNDKNLESLNVSNAAAILLYELSRYED